MNLPVCPALILAERVSACDVAKSLGLSPKLGKPFAVVEGTAKNRSQPSWLATALEC